MSHCKKHIGSVNMTEVKFPEDNCPHCKLEQARIGFKLYVASEGCGCCENHAKHAQAADIIGPALGFKRYSDDSGWDFYEREDDGKTDRS